MSGALNVLAYPNVFTYPNLNVFAYPNRKINQFADRKLRFDLKMKRALSTEETLHSL